MGMREDIERERVAKYGSFLYCEKRDTLCFEIYNELGICEKNPCILDTPEYHEHERIVAENQRRAWEEREREKREEKAAKEKPKCHRSQKERSLIIQIARTRNAARRAYEQNNPKLGESLDFKLVHLEGKYRSMRSAKSGN